MREINYRLIPEHMREGMKDYIEKGQAPGSFLSAVLCNDFMTAAARADHINLNALVKYIHFLYNEAPAGCHSSESNFKAWMEHRGLSGLAEGASRRTAETDGRVPTSRGIPPCAETGD